MEKLSKSPSQIEWKPRSMLMGLAVCAQLLLVGLAIWYSETMPTVSGPPRPLVSEVVVAEDLVFPDDDVSPLKGKQLPPIDVMKAAAGGPDPVRAGAELFAANCSTCHGPAGRGDGPAGAGLSPPPRDLTRIAGWEERTRVSDLFRTLTRGLPGTQMPAFDYLSHEERFGLVHFVRSLTSGHATDTRESLGLLDRDFVLSEGSREPNRVPLATALELVLNEASPGWEEDEQIKAPGAEIFDRVCDPAGTDRIRTLLAADRSWRNSVQRLKSLASSGTPSNGFSPEVKLLNDDDWQQLQSYLQKRYVIRPAAGADRETR
jgi:mono/diheme cytochrome c family protein